MPTSHAKIGACPQDLGAGDGMRLSRIVVCSTTTATGGPEALHQLVDALRECGHDAFICYLPIGETHRAPERFRRYNAPEIEFVDAPDVFLVVPETATTILRTVKHATAAVWWLSVDNFYGARRESRLRDLRTRITSLRRHRLPLSRLRRYYHFAQSNYALTYLARRGIRARLLTDYLGADYTSTDRKPSSRDDIVAFNPRKGRRRTTRLMRAYPEVEFIGIRDMTQDGVASLLRTAKIYVDFGHHPGKDRLPREAALAGCCVVTGRRGAAANDRDVPIPESYKLDDRGNAYLRCFGPLAKRIFADFESHSSNFDAYRRTILDERAAFQMEVREIFGNVGGGRRHLGSDSRVV